MKNLKIKNVDEMTVDELIGQLIMVGLPTTYLDEEYKELIKKYKIGNYILFARNYSDTNQMKSFMKELYEYTNKITNSFPLVSIDQEGGMVVRLFKDVTFPASPLTTSASSISDAPYKTGYIIGKDMMKLGLNLNLAPCLEINEELSNPLVNIRGYGAHKELVLKNASRFVKGIQDSGALSCIKHFPGAGSSTKDSHLELPIITESKEYLTTNNMYPFLHLLESDAIMSSHDLYESFDNLPCTLSKIMLTDLLRKQYNYKGLIISDGMEMKAIFDHYGMGKGTVMALNAGCDILLVCHDYEYQVEAFESIKQAIKNNELSIDLIKEKVRRINKAKEKVLDGLNKYFSDESYVINEEEHNLMENIVDESYTLILGTEPVLKENSLIISAEVKVASIVEDEFDTRNLTLALKKNLKNIDIVDFSNVSLENIGNYDNIIIYSYDAYNDEKQLNIINEILKLEKEVFVISLKGPIDKNYFMNLKNYSCLYEYTPNSIKTIIKQLNKKIALNGKLPL